MPLIGILAPNGKFYPCASYGHMELSYEICDKKGYSYFGVFVEDVLLKKNYIYIRARDCYKGGWDEDDNRIRITDEQFEFIVKHKGKWNNDSQYCDVLEMLQDDGRINEYEKIIRESEKQ